MITRESAIDAAVSDKKESAKNAGEGNETLRRIHDDLSALRAADQNVAAEMRPKIVCEPPPITPPCHPVDQPADPEAVRDNMSKLNTANRSLKDDLDALQPGASNKSEQYQRHLKLFAAKVKDCDTEVSNLNQLTKPDLIAQQKYDKDAILDEADKIDQLAKAAEKISRQMAKDH